MVCPASLLLFVRRCNDGQKMDREISDLLRLRFRGFCLDVMGNQPSVYDAFVLVVMPRLTTGILSEKCVYRPFRHCVNVIGCTYTNLDSIAYYTPKLYGISLLLLGYKPVQHVTVLNTVDNCNTMVI